MLSGIIDIEGIRKPLAALRYLSLIFLLRAPPVRERVIFTDDSESTRPLRPQSILGIVDDGAQPMSTLKLRKRKNANAGMVLIRPSFWRGRHQFQALLHRSSILADCRTIC